MRFVRFVMGSGSDAGVLDGNEIVPLERPLTELVDAGREALRDAGRRALGGTANRRPLASVELLPPIEPATIVAPGPRIDRSAARDLSLHREFYLKSAHTLRAGSGRIPYREAVGAISYRAQLGVVMAPGSGRWLERSAALEQVLGVVLVAELASVDLLRVGWEGTMWHVRYGEGGSFDGATVSGPWLATDDDAVIRDIVLEDAVGSAPVDLAHVEDHLSYVSRWIALGPDVLVLAGSAHGPVLTLDGDDPVVEFGPDEPRVYAGRTIGATGDGLGTIEVRLGETRIDQELSR
jgi:2-keto-4-pentenoate hydratase/2-oxohepta-3-ene-1,7-dioic acid hydratase in catechol pathway